MRYSRFGKFAFGGIRKQPANLPPSYKQMVCGMTNFCLIQNENVRSTLPDDGPLDSDDFWP